ncbi:hypothetical protein MRX96_057925 [Rhipicephalus microplus]
MVTVVECRRFLRGPLSGCICAAWLTLFPCRDEVVGSNPFQARSHAQCDRALTAAAPASLHAPRAVPRRAGRRFRHTRSGVAVKLLSAVLSVFPDVFVLFGA